MNPRKLAIREKAHSLVLKERDKMNWYLGQYIGSAVQAVLSPKGKYVDTPFLNDLGMTQEEIDNRELEKMIKAEEQWSYEQKSKNLSETIA